MNDEKSNDNLEEAIEQLEPDPRPVEWFRENSIPITGVIGLLLIFSVVSRWGGPTGWANAKEILGVWLDSAQFLALCLGGWWFCFKFIKGRAYRETLVVGVSGQIVKRGSQTYLIVIVHLENVGQSAVHFAPQTSSIQVFSYMDEQSDGMVVNEKEVAYFEAFKDLQLEPSQTIERSTLVRITDEVEFALRIELEVFDINADERSWSASKVILHATQGAIIDEQNFGVNYENHN